MLNFNAGLSALRASQAAMDVVANNIANANTPGYHRQTVHQVEEQPLYDGQFWRGTGVSISRINQIASRAVESALTANVTNLNQVDQALQLARQLESHFSPSEGSLDQRLQQFFEEFHQLQAQPDNGTQRQIVLNRSRALTNEINSLAGELDTLRSAARQEINQVVDNVNRQLEALARLDRQITQAQAAGQQPNSLLDQHQQLVNDIAESIDIVAIPQDRGFAYQFAQNHVSIEHTTFAVEAQYNNDGTVTFTRPGGGTELEFGGGRLAANAHALNELVPSFRQRLDDLTSTLIQEVNHIQATGVAASGSFNLLHGHRAVSDTTIPLADAGLDFDIGDGELFVTIYTPKGFVEQHQLDIDPNTQSLQDIADAISNLPFLQAVIDPETNRLSILADPQAGFDFSGQLPSHADTANVSGDADIRFSGSYTGSENETFTFQVVGTGQVGVDSSLQLQVQDSGGQTLHTFNLGNGYEPGSQLDLGNGISVAVDPGQLNDGDNFSVVGVADSDTSRVLTGLGLNSFFQGKDASNVRLSDDILDSPNRIAAGRTGASGDGSNITRLLQLRDEPLLGSGQSFENYVDGITADIAIEVGELTFLQADLSANNNALQKEREAISGVDPNEEMVFMLQYQRSFQAATRVISVIDQTLADLMNIVR
ncbi:MAG: flagellar hook-associated protein FlgK [Pirellulaceae bacterium]